MWASKNGEIIGVKAKKPSGNANRRSMARRVGLHGNRAAQTQRQSLRRKIRNAIGDKNANVDHLITPEGKLKLVIRLRKKTKVRSHFNTVRQPVVHKKTLSQLTDDLARSNLVTNACMQGAAQKHVCKV